MRALGRGLVELKRWPAEPIAPAAPAPDRFARALNELCGWMPPRRPQRYADWIIASARTFKVDPFLLGALIYRQSLCLPQQQSAFGIGLAAIHESMHREHIRRRRYRYWVFRDGRWQARERAMPDFLFHPANLRRPRPNIYFAAALMSVYKEQMPELGQAFGSAPYRHYISHLIWGDRVRDAGAEDALLRARRRLIFYFTSKTPARDQPAIGQFGELILASPLDGLPLRVTSGMGDERAEGARRHRGVDFASTFNEPVRAVAAGKVLIAGIDARFGASRNMDSATAQALKRSTLGPGGLYVMLRHDGGLKSAYMHLSRYLVKAGQGVERGQIIGYVGRSGMKISAAHLHFELRHHGKHLDPMAHFNDKVFGPLSSYLGRKLRFERERIARRRHHRRKLAPRAGPY